MSSPFSHPAYDGPTPSGTEQSHETPVRSSLSSDPDMVELIEFFVEEIPKRLEAIHRFVESGDRDGLQRISHQLKGACAGYGFAQIGQAAANIEGPLKADATLDDVRREIDELTDLLRRVVV